MEPKVIELSPKDMEFLRSRAIRIYLECHENAYISEVQTAISILKALEEELVKHGVPLRFKWCQKLPYRALDED